MNKNFIVIEFLKKEEIYSFGIIFKLIKNNRKNFLILFIKKYI